MTNNPASLQHARPRLKNGQAFAAMTSARAEAPLLFELADGSRQVSLPHSAAEMLPLLDGSRTIPEILETLAKQQGRVPFKSFFSTLQKLQTQGCLEGAETLATEDSASRAEMFEREPIWLTRPIFGFDLWKAKAISNPNLIAFLVAAIGSVLVTFGILASVFFADLIDVPSDFLRLGGSYVKGLVFFFVAASLLISAKTLLKTLLAILLTGTRSAVRLELNLFSLALRSHDDKIYMAGGRAIGAIAFVAVASSYFFVFAAATALAMTWSPGWSLIDRAALGLPFRQAAIQHRDIGLAHQPEGPPDPRRRENARPVVDDDLMAIAHAHRPHPADEHLGWRGHVRQAGPLVGDLVNVEEPGAGNVCGAIFGPGIPTCVRQIPACIQDPQVGILQMRLEPFGGNQGFGVVCHRCLSSHSQDLAGSGDRRQAGVQPGRQARRPGPG